MTAVSVRVTVIDIRNSSKIIHSSDPNVYVACRMNLSFEEKLKRAEKKQKPPTVEAIHARIKTDFFVIYFCIDPVIFTPPYKNFLLIITLVLVILSIHCKLKAIKYFSIRINKGILWGWQRDTRIRIWRGSREPLKFWPIGLLLYWIIIGWKKTRAKRTLYLLYNHLVKEWENEALIFLAVKRSLARARPGDFSPKSLGNLAPISISLSLNLIRVSLS